MTGMHVTEELGMRLEEKDLEAWGGKQCVERRKTGSLAMGGRVLRKRPVTEEIKQRQMGRKCIHRIEKRIEEVVLVWCLLLPLWFQMDKRIQQMFKKKKKKPGKQNRLWDYLKNNLLFLMSSQRVSYRKYKIYGMIPRGRHNTRPEKGRI